MSTGYPKRDEAEAILLDALNHNPGPWGHHSYVTAHCAQRIAQAVGMDGEKAYVLGLLHDIGRKFGVYHMPHIYNGYHYLLELGYPEAARICLTHSFSTPDFRTYIGQYDVTDAQKEELRTLLAACEYDDYDRLIQLCDCLAGSTGVVDMEERMEDVKHRYGEYPQEKWDNNLRLKAYFEARSGRNIYDIVR